MGRDELGEEEGGKDSRGDGEAGPEEEVGDEVGPDGEEGEYADVGLVDDEARAVGPVGGAPLAWRVVKELPDGRGEDGDQHDQRAAEDGVLSPSLQQSRVVRQNYPSNDGESGEECDQYADNPV